MSGGSARGLSLTYRAADVPPLRVINEAYGRDESRWSHILGDSATFSPVVRLRRQYPYLTTRKASKTATTAGDLEVALQLLYLRATGFEPDSLAFKRFIDGQRNNVAHRRLNPTPGNGRFHTP